VTEEDQLFYSEEDANWKSASNFWVQDIQEEIVLYKLSIDDLHNYYITPSGLIAHNFAMAIAAAAPGLGAVVGTAIIVGTVAVAIDQHVQDNKKSQSSSSGGFFESIFQKRAKEREKAKIEEETKKAEEQKKLIENKAKEEASKKVNQMNQEIKKGKAPKTIERVDQGDSNIPGSKPHVHYTDGTSSNYEARKWLETFGWTPPPRR